MRYLICILCFLFNFVVVYASDYSLFDSGDYSLRQNQNEKILFILDFSSSMNEFIDGDRKVDLMINTMKKILPTVNQNSILGLRVYGHRRSFTPLDSCRASSMLVPLSQNNSNEIYNRLLSLSPKGMTPITYSLKQAIKKDFLGISGNKRIILLTDGGENCDESPCDYVIELIKTRDDIFIDVIAFNISDENDLEQLKCAALVTRGKFYSAETSAELIKSLSDSVSARKDVEARIVPNY